MSALAGRLATRLALLRRDAARDAMGAAAGDWAEVALVRARVEPLARGGRAAGDDAATLGRWRVTLRPCAIAEGDRLAGAGFDLRVLHVTRDPATPDRMVADAEEMR